MSGYQTFCIVDVFNDQCSHDYCASELTLLSSSIAKSWQGKNCITEAEDSRKPTEHSHGSGMHVLIGVSKS